MAVNKVIFGGDTIIDLTADTVTAETLAVGVTAHDKSGTKITGTMEAGSGGGSHENCIPYEADFMYTVDPIDGADYGFALNGEGYYESQNKGQNNSYAICRVNLDVKKTCDITFDVINYGEAKYDYGIFGLIDTGLTLSNTKDSSAHKFFNQTADTSNNVVQVTYSNVQVGSHYIDVKFIKDSSGNKNNDSVRFKLINEIGFSNEALELIRKLEPELLNGNIRQGVDIFGVIGNVVEAWPGGLSTFYGSYTPTGDSYLMSVEKFPDERDYNLLAVWAIDDVSTSFHVKYIIQSLQNGTAVRITGDNSASAYDTTALIFPSGTSQADNCFASFYEGGSYNAASWRIYANTSSSGGIKFKEGVTYCWVFAKVEI